MTRAHRFLGVLATACSLPLLSTAASATDPAPGSDPGDSSALQEVVVTSSYKEQSNDSVKMGVPIRDTPLSIESYTNSFMTSIEISR